MGRKWRGYLECADGEIRIVAHTLKTSRLGPPMIAVLYDFELIVYSFLGPARLEFRMV